MQLSNNNLSTYIRNFHEKGSKPVYVLNKAMITNVREYAHWQSY